MKTTKAILALLLPLGLMAVLFQGCYTQVATTREDESTYEQTDKPSTSQDEEYGEESGQWHPHSYIGFSYYYPMWRSSWGWDGCYYPAYWDPWYTPVIYPYFAFYPYHINYWYPHHGYGYYSVHNGSSYTSYTSRTAGYQRSGNIRRDYGVVRSTSGSSRSVIDGRTGTSRRDLSFPRAGTAGSQGGNAGTVRSNRGSSAERGVSTTRRLNREYSPSVQQPRHRSENQPAVGGTSRRESSNQSRGESSSRSSRPSQSAPSYSPPAQRTSPPPSAPAPSSSGGERRSSGDSGRRR